MSHVSASIGYIPKSKLLQGKFGRLFRNLPVWTPEGSKFFDLDKSGQQEVIRKLVVDDLEMIGKGAANKENPDIPAGYTYFGQFIDHDMTFDPASNLMRQNDPDELVNFRSPCLDLDNVYGRGPADQPYLYDEFKFVIGDNGHGEEDLPRLVTDPSPPEGKPRPGVALIGDMRNDENIIVSQLQLAFLRLHNKIFDNLEDKFSDKRERFREAQRLTRWHYQWVVLHDYAKRLCGGPTIDKMINMNKGKQSVYEGPKLNFYDPKNNPFMPVEFSGAAFRLGHSMIRDGYRLSDKLNGSTGDKEIKIFVPKKSKSENSDEIVGEFEDLRGFRRLPEFWTIQWDKYVEFKGSNPQKSMLIDKVLSDPLANIPEFLEEHAANSPIVNLAIRNVLRGIALGLPSGQAVAKRMGFEPLDGDDLPLWIYVLAEAQAQKSGKALGAVGSRIVGEVLVGLIARDPGSFLKVQPEWKPEKGANFDLAAFLEMSGSPMTADDIDAQTGTNPPANADV